MNVLDRKWLAMSSYSYFLSTHTKSTCRHTNTHSVNTFYRSCAYFLLAEHHTAQSPLNLPQASLLTCPPFDTNWPLSELLPAAACGHVSWSITTHSAPREHLLLARSGWRTCRVKMMIGPYDHSLFFPTWERFSITSSVVWLRDSVTLPVVCLSVCVIHDILTLYQHNWGSCLVGLWITFHWCVWVTWLIHCSCAYWPKYALHSGETLRPSGCHVTSGINRAEKKGRVSQKQHVHTKCAATCKTKSPVTILFCLYNIECYKTTSSYQTTLYRCKVWLTVQTISRSFCRTITSLS